MSISTKAKGRHCPGRRGWRGEADRCLADGLHGVSGHLGEPQSPGVVPGMAMSLSIALGNYSPTPSEARSRFLR